jgi:methionyl-tRNA formyltransferase
MKTLEIKIITTRVCTHESVQFNEADDIAFVNGALVFPCGRSTTLEVCVILRINHEVSVITVELNHSYTI